MSQKKQLSILEFSRLTGIKRENLRFYDRIGLLSPEARGENGYRYYWDGITPSVAVLVKAIDQERMAVAQAYGVKVLSAEEWLRQSYDTYGDNLYELLQHNQAYADIKAPKTIDARYVTEDVPMSLVPISELGRIAGVATPNIDSVITLTSTIYRKDFRKEGRCAENLGIQGMNKDQVAHYFETGVKA